MEQKSDTGWGAQHGHPDRERIRWWRAQMRDWAMLWRKYRLPLAVEHAIQNRDIANQIAARLGNQAGTEKPKPPTPPPSAD